MKNNNEIQSIKSGGRYAKKKYKCQIIGSILLSLLQEKYYLKGSQLNVQRIHLLRIVPDVSNDNSDILPV